MLEKEQYLEAYEHLTNSCFPIWEWKYDSQLNVISSNCSHESLFHTLLLESQMDKALKKHMAQSYLPFIYMCDSALCWIAAFEKDFHIIYIKGPLFNTIKDPETYDALLSGSRLSPEAKHILKETFPSLPVIATNLATILASMLHYAIHQESISESDISIRVTERHITSDQSVSTDQLTRRNIHWEMEDEVLDKIRRGDTNIMETMGKFVSNHPDFQKRQHQSLEYQKQNINTLLSLVSRAAVDGGLPRKTSYAICGQYRRRIMAATSSRELTALNHEALIEYASRVSNTKKYHHCSKPIRLCCEYINHHPNEKITLNDLADRIGYTQYHLSRKFKQEMGISLVDYIQDVKIEHAQFILRTKEMAVDDIAAELHFGSGSYFSSVFRKKTGESPSEYRKKHEII